MLHHHLVHGSRDGLLLFEGERLVEANAVGLRTFRAPGCRRGERWVPWLAQQLQSCGRRNLSAVRQLYQRASGDRIAQYAVRIHRLTEEGVTQWLVRSHFLGWVDLRQVALAPSEQESHIEELKLLLDSTLVGKILLSEDGQVLYSNPVAAGLFGKTPQALQSSYLGLPLEVGRVVEIDIPHGEELRTAEVSTVPIPWPRGPAYLATLTDVSERNQSRERLQLLQKAWEQSPVALVIADAAGAIEYVNPAFESVTGYSLADVRGQNPRLLASGDTPRSVYEQMWRTLGEGRVWRGEFRNRRRSGEVYWEDARIAPVRDGSGEVTHYVAVKEDVSERKRTQELLQLQANYDALTGLPNRQLLLQLLASLLLLEKRRQGRLAILFLDLDGFKQVNDQAGHAAGDQLLRQVARRLRQAVREQDVVARQSGDEFIILCPDLNSDLDAEQVAERVLVSLQVPFMLGGTASSWGPASVSAVFPTAACRRRNCFSRPTRRCTAPNRRVAVRSASSVPI